MDDKGEIENAKDLRKSIKDDWSDHIETQSQSGANTANPPANTGGKGKTLAEIQKMTDAEARQAAMLENFDSLGI